MPVGHDSDWTMKRKREIEEQNHQRDNEAEESIDRRLEAMILSYFNKLSISDELHGSYDVKYNINTSSNTNRNCHQHSKVSGSTIRIKATQFSFGS